MKKICTLIIIILLTLSYNSQAQTTVNISSNTTWSAAPACTSNCIFNISSGVTLTINKSFTCATCTFNGGSIIINKDLACQPCTFSSNTITLNSAELKPNSSTTSFSNVTFTANGTADILANTPVNVTNSKFTFNGTSYFQNNGGTLNLTNSSFYFYGSSYFLANAGPVNLMSSSRMVAGDGSVGSTAYIKMNGPALNIYDNSIIALANKNNSYFNWGSYNYYATTASPTHLSYSNPTPPSYYGIATVSGTGFNPGSILPVTLTDFSADFNNHSVEILWSTAEEINFDHFVIERSSNGSSWVTIATVQAKEKNSNDYSFTDLSPIENSSFYRLQMVDKNGTISYSKIVAVKTDAVTSQVTIFPNPIINATFHIKLTSSDAASINVFNIEGRLLYATSLKGQTQYEVNLPNAATSSNGYLIIQVISNGKTNTFSILNKK